MSIRAAVAAVAITLTLPLRAAEKPAATPAPTVSKAPLEQAREAVGKGDFAAAAKILRAEADRGNADAASALGEFYLSGSGVKASLTDAVTWFKKAADATNSAGMFNLGRILMVGGEGVAKDEDKARFLIRSAAEAGYAPAQFAEGQAAEQVEEKVRDYAEALAWYEKAAAQEHAPALLAIGRFYDVGLSVQRDPAKGTENFMKAARSGSPVAMNEMGVRYQKGAGVRPDNVAAIGWFTVAAQYGLPAALVNLGNCYEVGNGVRIDFDQAGRNYAAAAKQHFAPAEFLLAQMFEQGKGTKPNLANAYVLYTRAASQKNEEAAKRAASIKEKLSKEQLEEANKLLGSGAIP